MIKHTPGYWFTEGHSVVSEDGGVGICTCSLEAMQEFADSRAEEETMANIRLIASAPQLLYALQDLYEHVKTLQQNHSVQTRVRLVSARDAIAMATGERP